jgi:murein DD-endopeptidase MepM/ murein hydrolase activator NlpD
MTGGGRRRDREDAVTQRVSDTFQAATGETVDVPDQSIALEHMLSGIRKQESGSFRGNYTQRGPFVNGNQLYGAYNINKQYWAEWTELAGIPGASIRSPNAQDQVANYIINSYLKRFGTWELAAMAWFAGPQEAAKVMRRGYVDIDSIQNPRIKEYINGVMQNANQALAAPNAAYLKRIPISDFSYSGGGNWVMPVAGNSDWGRGSWMPNTLTHRGRTHAAIDIYATEGTPIVAPVSGKVISTKKGELGGNTVRILGDDGITYYFAHMAEQAVVNTGDRVLPGYHLGYVGTTGSARGTSPHLHFSMKEGNKVVNPISFLTNGSTARPAPKVEDVSFTQAARPVSSGLNRWLQKLSSTVAKGNLVDPEDAMIDDRPNLDDEKTDRIVNTSRTPEQETRMI